MTDDRHLPDDPREFIEFAIREHERAIEVLEGDEREEWLAGFSESRMADADWHREVNIRYRRVAAALTERSETE